jgi:hypothetical protein
MSKPEYITMTQAAMRAKLSYSTMANHVIRGQVKGVQIDGRWCVDAIDLARFLQERSSSTPVRRAP